MDKPPSRLPLIIGLVLVAAGWAAIALGWWRSTQFELETGQLPFILSGGFGGAGLLLLGAAGVLVDVVQRTQWHARRALADIRDALAGLRSSLDAVAHGLEEDDEAAEPVAVRRRARRSRSARSRHPQAGG